MSTFKMVFPGNLRLKNRRLGIILALFMLLYIAGVIAFIIAY
jgi:hypothetical protein